MKNVILLGATGSIGTQTLDVINGNKKDFKLIGLSLGRNKDKNIEILDNNNVEIAALRDDKEIESYKKRYPKIKFVYGDAGLISLAKYPIKCILVNALSGGVGLLPTYEALKSGKDIGLANKETLVMGGDLIMSLAKEMKLNIYPIDSEHNAIWLLLKGERIEDVKKIVITASGGAFRDKTREELVGVSVEDALKHPNWSMGPKITIDSATMANKCLEIIEAHHLFGLPYGKIETILHKESLVHGFVHLKDNTIKCELGNADMRIPISTVLYYPFRKETASTNLSFENLSFKVMDENRFPLIKLIYQVGNKGGLYPAVFTSANDAAVELFLNKKIEFLDIEKIIFDEVKMYDNKLEYSLESIIEVSEETKKRVFRKYGGNR